MANSKWPMANRKAGGQWQMANRVIKWQMANGKWEGIYWSEVGGGNAAVPNGAYFLLGACRGGRIRIQGFSDRPCVRTILIFVNFDL